MRDTNINMFDNITTGCYLKIRHIDDLFRMLFRLR